MTDEVRQALRICPLAVREAIERTPLCGSLEEVRFRCGTSIRLYANRKETELPRSTVTKELLQDILSAATEHSVYAAQSTIRQGFITLAGGHRLGLCGMAVEKDGEVTTLRDISSMNLRIARQHLGCADSAADYLWTHPRSALIIGAPASGKTTLLRDLIRIISDRFLWRVSVVDERMELACCLDGMPQLKLGAHTDVLSGTCKQRGIEMLLRTMNPQWIALDEITAEADVEAIVRASYCGIRFLATAHAVGREDLHHRPVYQKLMQAQIFENLITILPNRQVRTEGM